MENKFKSKNRNGIWYVIGNEGNHSYFYQNTKMYISSTVFEFNDLNDNGTQHTPLTLSVVDNLIDFLDSFIIWLNDGNEYPDYLPIERFGTKNKINLIKTFKIKEGKTLYYSFQLSKTSYNEKYSYDKRYEKLYEDFNLNKVKDIYNLVCERYYSAFDIMFLINNLDNNYESVYGFPELYKNELNINYSETLLWARINIIKEYYNIKKSKEIIKRNLDHIFN